jgi:hypothetical protein
MLLADRVLDRVATLCTETGGRFLDWRAYGCWEDWEDEWYAFEDGGIMGVVTDEFDLDEQIGQMYELMQAIRKQQTGENDPEQ